VGKLHVNYSGNLQTETSKSSDSNPLLPSVTVC